MLTDVTTVNRFAKVESNVRAWAEDFEWSYRQAISFLLNRPDSLVMDLLGYEHPTERETLLIRAFIEETANNMHIVSTSRRRRSRLKKRSGVAQ